MYLHLWLRGGTLRPYSLAQCLQRKTTTPRHRNPRTSADSSLHAVHAHSIHSESRRCTSRSVTDISNPPRTDTCLPYCRNTGMHRAYFQKSARFTVREVTAYFQKAARFTAMAVTAYIQKAARFTRRTLSNRPQYRADVCLPCCA